ncbi:hypothetical protein ACHAWF_010790 [Thalassiosira exigua]
MNSNNLNGSGSSGNPATMWDEAAAVLSGLVGGGRYGLKIRVPHALVMTFLFGSHLSFRKKLRVIASLAAEHASNLAAFACLYKLALGALKVLGPRLRRSQIQTAPGLPERPHHAFLAGALGGYFVWGRYSGVNYQLILYLASRILAGCIKLAREKGIPPFSWKKLTFARTYPWAAAGIWGTVMMLFEEHPEVLHPSLRRSMDEIYRFSSFGSEDAVQSHTR